MKKGIWTHHGPFSNQNTRKVKSIKQGIWTHHGLSSNQNTRKVKGIKQGIWTHHGFFSIQNTCKVKGMKTGDLDTSLSLFKLKYQKGERHENRGFGHIIVYFQSYEGVLYPPCTPCRCLVPASYPLWVSCTILYHLVLTIVPLVGDSYSHCAHCRCLVFTLYPL